jgi:uncharacterized membrane protein YedE/YeeE
MRPRVAAAVVGAVFGATLSWTGMTSPDVIRQGLLFERSYLFLFFAAAVGTAFLGLRILRARRPRALLTGERVEWAVDRPQRRHVVGSLIFGVGWAIADACPGPIATQVGEGIPWALFTLAGTFAGVWLFLRRGARETEPAADAAPPAGGAIIWP